MSNTNALRAMAWNKHEQQRLVQIRRCYFKRNTPLKCVASYVTAWALIYWEELHPHVEGDMHHASSEGVELDWKHFQRRLATRLNRKR